MMLLINIFQNIMMMLMWNSLCLLWMKIKFALYPHIYNCGCCKMKHQCWTYIDSFTTSHPACEDFEKE